MGVSWSSEKEIASGWEGTRERFRKELAFPLSLAGKVGLDRAASVRTLSQKLR